MKVGHCSRISLQQDVRATWWESSKTHLGEPDAAALCQPAAVFAVGKNQSAGWEVEKTAMIFFCVKISTVLLF